VYYYSVNNHQAVFKKKKQAWRGRPIMFPKSKCITFQNIRWESPKSCKFDPYTIRLYVSYILCTSSGVRSVPNRYPAPTDLADLRDEKLWDWRLAQKCWQTLNSTRYDIRRLLNKHRRFGEVFYISSWTACNTKPLRLTSDHHWVQTAKAGSSKCVHTFRSIAAGRKETQTTL